jgi:hypothetical protein
MVQGGRVGDVWWDGEGVEEAMDISAEPTGREKEEDQQEQVQWFILTR